MPKKQGLSSFDGTDQAPVEQIYAVGALLLVAPLIQSRCGPKVETPR